MLICEESNQYRKTISGELFSTPEAFTRAKRKEIFLFYDAFNTFYLRLYDVGHKVADHSDSERENPVLQHHGLFCPFICTISQTRKRIPRPLLH